MNFNRRQPRQAIHDVGCQDGHSSSIAAVVVLVNKKEVSDRLARKQIALRASVRGVTGRMLGRRCGPSACKSRAPMRVSALFASRVPERQLSSGRAGLRTLRKGGRRGRARRSRAVGSVRAKRRKFSRGSPQLRKGKAPPPARLLLVTAASSVPRRASSLARRLPPVSAVCACRAPRNGHGT